MNRNEIRCQGGRDMHRPAIDTDDEGGMAQQPNELQKCRLARELDAVFRRRKFAVRFSDKNNASGRERATKLLDDRARDRFATTPRMRVQNDEARERIEAREGIS